MIRIIFYALVASVPISYRVVWYKFTPGFFEYTTAFLYAADILAVMLIAAVFWLGKGGTGDERQRWERWLITAYIAAGAAAVAWAPIKWLAVYGTVRTAMLAAVALAAAKLIKERVVSARGTLAALTGAAAVEALIGIAQFKAQGGMGLGFLGEPNLAAGGISKIAAGAGLALRAYGTFLHPNILAVFLAVGTVIVLTALTYTERPWNRYGLLILLYIIMLGLLTTFSRSGWIGAIMGMAAALGLAATSLPWRRVAFAGVVAVAAIAAAVWPVREFVLPRATVAREEPAVTARLAYAEMAWEIIKEHPLGIGIGNQTYVAYNEGLYEQTGMSRPAQWQPVHNIYLLAAAETGVVGGATFTLLIVYAMASFGRRFYKRRREGWRWEEPAVLGVAAVLIVVGMFDHFLMTIAAGQFILWLAIGLLLAGVYNGDKKARP